MSKHILIYLTLVGCTGISCMASADYFTTDAEDVQADPAGYWSCGVIAGNKGQMSVKGTLIPSKEVTILLGKGPTTKKKDISVEKLPVSAHEQEILERLQELPENAPVVLKYVHPYPPTFHWNRTKYFITDVSLAGRPFEDSHSWEKFGYDFYEPSPEPGSLVSGQKSGRIVHVSRWGRIFGTTCTAYLHEGGTKDIVSTKYRSKTVWKVNLETGENEQVIKQEPYQHTETVPNISIMNIYSESGCRFAEDATISMVPMTVDFSMSRMELWHAHNLTIHNMRVRREEPSVR